MLLRALSWMVYQCWQFMTILEHWVGQIVAAFGQWRRWLECIVQQQNIEHLMWKLRDVAVTLDNNWENKQVVLLLFFRTHCYRYRLVLNCCFKNTDISLGSVATQLRCGEISSDNVTTNFLLISKVKKNLKIGSYLTKLLVYKNFVPLFWPTLYSNVHRLRTAAAMLGLSAFHLLGSAITSMNPYFNCMLVERLLCRRVFIPDIPTSRSIQSAKVELFYSSSLR